MNGPASADGRRTISIKIDSSWGTTTNAQIWNATQDAKDGWNDATDSNNHKTGYFLEVQQGNQNPQIIIQKGTPAGGGCASVTIHASTSMMAAVPYSEQGGHPPKAMTRG